MILGLRVEWAKTRARSERWREDIRLLEEEMRRSLEFTWWLSNWWLSQASRRTDIAPHVAEGLRAYAVEQSNVEQRRAIRWTTQWAAVRERASAVLESQLSNVEMQVPLPELVVELNNEDEMDNEDDLNDEDEV